MSAASRDLGLSGTTRSPAPWPDVMVGLSVAVLAAAIGSAALLVSPRFFLTDDYATYFMPGFREIAMLLRHGQFPLLTDRIWNGGALFQEYQYAVFNPVSLALYLLISQSNDLALGAAVFSLVHVGILAGGVFFLCRVLNCARRHAFLAAVAAPLSDWIFYWGAADWIPALVSLAWLVWAWAFLVLTFRRPKFAPAAAAMTAMTLLSGWPFTDFALLVSVLVAGRMLFAAKPTPPLRAAAWPVLALTGGGLISMAAILPVAFYVTFTHRPPVEGHWAADLTGLLEFGMPLVHVRWGTFSVAEYQTVSYPIVYAAWFAPLALAGANWKRLLADRAVWLVLGSAGAFAALSMISHVGLLRWMFRLLPYFHVSVLVLAAMALTRADEDGEVWSFDRLALVIAAEVWLAFGQSRELALTYLAVAYVLGTLAWVSTRFGDRRDVRWTAMAVATTFTVFGLTLWQASNGGWPQYPRPWRLPTAAEASGSSGTRFQFVHPPSANADPGPIFWATHPLGNATLYGTGRSFGGYSPMPTPLFAGLSCWGRLVDRCDDVIPNATGKVDPTGRSLLDLAGVNEVDVQRQTDANAFAAAVGADWNEDRGPGGDWRFTRKQPLGLVTWTSPGVQAGARSDDLTKVVLDARNDASTNGALVIARAWYPTWRASLDGAPARSHPLDDTLVVVDLPPKSHGLLTVTFWPKGLTAGFILAAFGAILMAAAALFPALVDRPASWIETLLSRQPRRTQPVSVDIS